MSDIVHQPCPYEDCASSDAFSWNPEGYGYCHSCGSSYPSSKKVFSWAREEYPVKDLKNMDRKVTSVTYEGIRSLDPDVAKLYGIQVQRNSEGEPVQYAYKYPHTIKYRDYYDKSKSWIRDKGVGMTHLFGPEFNAGSSKRLYITEGEFDAASLYQILGKSFPVKSLPSASIGDAFMKQTYDYLSSFQEIVYAGELDAAGKRAADKLYRAYPEKFYYVPMTKWKDANEFLENGSSDDLKWAALKPQRFSPDNFFCSDIEVERILREENPYAFTPTGHSGLDGKIRGLVKGGVTFIKAPPGSGKTELVRYFERSMFQQEVPIALIHMEEMKSLTYRAMATYELGVNVRTKEDAATNLVDEEDVIKAALKATGGDRTILFEMRPSDSPLDILEYVRLAATVYGAEYIFVDHIQRLAYLLGLDNATNTLTQLASGLAEICKELDIGVIIISHVNQDGKTKYATSLEEEAIILIEIERDSDSEDELVRNTTNFRIGKNRPFSLKGDAGMVHYDEQTTILKEKVYEGV